jgi:hypothetical protein
MRAARPRAGSDGTPRPRPWAAAPAQEHAARLERRRRRRHLQRLRRDLVLDLAAALGLTIAVLIGTAGLGVVALLEIPVAGLVLASFVVERRRRPGRVIKKRRYAGKIDQTRR